MQLSVPTACGLYALSMSALDSVVTPFYVDALFRHVLWTARGIHDGTAKHSALVSSSRHGASLSSDNASSPAASSPSAPGVVTTATETHSSSLLSWPLLCFVTGQLMYVVLSVLGDVGVGWVAAVRLYLASHRRFSRLAFVGPLWAMLCAALWLPVWPPLLPAGLSATVGIACYNALSTLSADALRATSGDTSWAQNERERSAVWAAAWDAVGRLVVGPAAILYELGSGASRGGLLGFRVFAVGLAIAAAGTFGCSGRSVQKSSSSVDPAVTLVVAPPPRGGSDSWSPGSPSRMSDGSGAETHPQAAAQRFWAFVGQTMGRPSMKALTVLWALEAYSYTLATTFFGLFLVVGCSATVAPSVRACLMVSAFVAPYAIAAGLTPLLPSIGRKRALAAALTARLGLAVTVIVLGIGILAQAQPGSRIRSTASSVFALLLVVNRVLTELVGRLQALALSDVFDEDTIIFGRPRSATGAIQRLMAVVSRPAQCLALSFAGVHLSTAVTVSPHALAAGAVPAREVASVVLFLGVNVALTTGVMLGAWQHWYTLEGRHLRFIQMAMRKRTEDAEVGQV